MRALVTTVPLAQIRWHGRIPRLALIAACAVLSLAGLRSLTTTHRPVAAARSAQPVDLVDARGLATQYAVDYLTFIPDGDDRRILRLSALGAAEDTVAQDRVGTIRSRVAFAVPVAERRTAAGADVTVAARRAGAWTYLRIPVRRDGERLFVSAAPAVVGSPPVDRARLTRPEDEVQDRALVTVGERVVRHYVRGDGGDLSADLDRGARVDLPSRWLRVVRIDRTTWVQPGVRVAVGVTARGPDGLRLSLRYELAVVRRSGRWLVTAIGDPNPTTKEIHR